MENNLQHHGIKGQRWGVRRYQNKDGTLTEAGKRRNSESDTEKNTERNKKIVLTGIGIATVAASAYYVHKNPERIGQVMAQSKGVKVKDISQSAIDKGKIYVGQAIKNAKEGMKEGFREGFREAPKKTVKTVVTGVVLNETKKALDSKVGKEESARIFQANDNKKIGNFWKVSIEDKDD